MVITRVERILSIPLTLIAGTMSVILSKLQFETKAPVDGNLKNFDKVRCEDPHVFSVSA